MAFLHSWTIYDTNENYTMDLWWNNFRTKTESGKMKTIRSMNNIKNVYFQQQYNKMTF